MKRFILIVLGLVIADTVYSQKKVQDSVIRRKIEYYFQVQSGALIGCSSCSSGTGVTFSGAFTHGMKIGRKLRVGAGVGFDSYFDWNTVPVYGSASWDVFGKKNAFFIELNYGGSLASWRNTQYEEYGYQNSQGGKMFSYGLGYRIKYEDLRISVGIGHKTQLSSSYYEYPTFYWNNNNMVPGEPSRRTVTTEMNRLMIWVAVGWK